MAEATEPSFAAKNAGKACALGLTVVVLATAVAAASGPLYQAGVLPLMQAFAVLGGAVTWGLGIGALVCLIGLILGIVAFKGDVMSHAATGLLGLIIAGLVFYVPYNLQSRNAPPIHEITTDFENPPAFVDIVPLREETGATNEPQYVANFKRKFGERDFEVDVMAAQKETYGDIEPVRIEGTNYEAVFDRALQAVNDMGWTLVSANPQLGRIEAYDKTAWFGFIDDVVIRVEAAPMAYEIDIRSKSRIGIGDAGANAERVRKYLKKVSGASGHG